MALTGEGFQNIGENFEEYEGKINAGRNIDEIVANHRLDLYHLLQDNIIEWKDDETNLQKLTTQLEAKRDDAGKDLWKHSWATFAFDETSDTVQDFWKGIASWTNSKLKWTPWISDADPDETDTLKDDLKEILKQLEHLQFKHDGTQDLTWQIFDKDITKNVTKSSKNNIFADLYKETKAPEAEKKFNADTIIVYW